MSKKSGKSVPSVVDQKPSKETKQPEGNVVSSDTSGQSAQVATTQVSVEQQPQISPLEDLKARMLTPATIEKAKVVGLDLQPLLDYGEALEVRHLEELEFRKSVEKAFEHVGVVLDKIAPLAELADQYKKAAAAQPQGQPQPQGGGLGITVPQLLQAIMSGGGGGSDETTKWLADIGRENLMVSRIVFQEFAKKIVPDILDKMAEEAKRLQAAK